MIYAMAIGMAILALFRIYDKETIRVQWNSVAAFIAFMTLATFLRIAGYDFMAEIDPSVRSALGMSPMRDMPVWRFALVFWEDAFFVLPMFLAFKYMKKKYAITIAILLSALFASGHAYQGIAGMLVTSIYPYFLSYKYGKKHGFGTIMVCHVLYDFITYFTVFLMPYLI